jgi:hypothetical protein
VNRAARFAALTICCLALATAGHAELAPWDQARVTELGKQLEAATLALDQSVQRIPPPGPGSPQRLGHFRLQQQTRQLRREARSMSRSLQRGADKDQAQPSWESMMLTVRDARENARRMLTAPDVQERANTAREILNQLAPFFDANAQPLEPVAR